MAIVTSVTAVSYRYYDKRARRVAEQNVAAMCRVLDEPTPDGLSEMPKSQLIRLALHLHDRMPA